MKSEGGPLYSLLDRLGVLSVLREMFDLLDWWGGLHFSSVHTHNMHALFYFEDLSVHLC
jgi:hypothetical protein